MTSPAPTNLGSTPHVFVKGRWQDNPPPKDVSLMIADPVYGSDDVKQLVSLAVSIGLPSCIFMMPEEIWGLPHKPDQLIHWVKPVSTKNTAKRYSRFVEAIACYGVEFHDHSLHWSNRTGIFTDCLFTREHEWKKPEPLIERLLRNHWPGSGIVYDPCAGSRTVETVCRRLGIQSFSVESGEFSVCSSAIPVHNPLSRSREWGS